VDSKEDGFLKERTKLKMSSRHVVVRFKAHLLAPEPNLYLLNPGTRELFAAGKVLFRDDVFLTRKKACQIFRNPFSDAF
jgi:hypothetical protein